MGAKAAFMKEKSRGFSGSASGPPLEEDGAPEDLDGLDDFEEASLKGGLSAAGAILRFFCRGLVELSARTVAGEAQGAACRAMVRVTVLSNVSLVKTKWCLCCGLRLGLDLLTSGRA
jgi:hypothetical protein